MLLLIDMGNSRVKWTRARIRSTRLTLSSADAPGYAVLDESQAADHSQWRRDDFIANVLQGPPAQRVLIANVAGARLESIAREALAQTWQIEPQFMHSTAFAAGVRNAYGEPAKLGVDRWLGLIAARAMCRGSVCIVSAGTACTVDGLDGEGRHLGGVILPGPRLMMSSLMKGTSEIGWRAAGGSARDSLFADNTLGALQQGALHALAALVERAMQTMEQQLGERPALLFTGGGGGSLRAAVGYESQEIPDLVLRGLAVMAQETATLPPT